MSTREELEAQISFPQDSLTNPNAQIRLQVGEREFRTSRQTLVGESPFFASLLSGRWNILQPDGTIFLDADPDLFEHILRYLRRSIYPLCFRLDVGHDLALYARLFEEARYFGIARLEQWLGHQRYLDAFHVRRSVDVRVVDLPFDPEFDETFPANTRVSYQCTPEIRRIYICPRGIDVHEGKPLACGKQCMEAKAMKGETYVDQPCMRIITTKEELILHKDICLIGGEFCMLESGPVAPNDSPNDSPSPSEM